MSHDLRIVENRPELPRIAYELPPELPKSWSVMQPHLVSHSCPDDTFRARSRGAALMYAENGGAFSVDVVRDDDDGAVEMEVPKIAKHQVLKGELPFAVSGIHAHLPQPGVFRASVARVRIVCQGALRVSRLPGMGRLLGDRHDH